MNELQDKFIKLFNTATLEDVENIFKEYCKELGAEEVEKLDIENTSILHNVHSIQYEGNGNDVWANLYYAPGRSVWGEIDLIIEFRPKIYFSLTTKDLDIPFACENYVKADGTTALAIMELSVPRLNILYAKHKVLFDRLFALT